MCISGSIIRNCVIATCSKSPLINIEMSNKLILYNLDLSPPVRTVKIVARLLGLNLELR